jgi:hypothetical protein
MGVYENNQMIINYIKFLLENNEGITKESVAFHVKNHIEKYFSKVKLYLVSHFFIFHFFIDKSLFV